MIYFLIFFLIFFFALKYDFRAKINTERYVKFIFFVLIIIAGIRYRVGTDTLVYMDEYEAGPGYLNFIKDKYLIGWYFLIKVFHYFDFSFYMVQFAVAIIINIGIFRFIKASIPFAVFSGLLLYYSLLYPGWNFEILRQAICISIFFIALPYVEKGKLFVYYILIGLACTIHETAFVLLFIPLFLRLKVTNKILLIITLLILIFVISAPFVRKQVYNYALLLVLFQNKAAHYFENVEFGESFNISSYLINMVLNIAIPLFAIKRNIKKRYLPNSFIILSILSLFGYSLSTMLPMMYRVNYYFSLFPLILFIVLFWDLSCNCRNKRLCFFSFLLVFVLFKGRIYFIEKNNIPAYIHYYPYKCIFNEEKVPQRESIDNL